MSNLNPAQTQHVPVRIFLRRHRVVKDQIAGLLDYGYSQFQIAKMLNMNRIQIEQIILDNHYKTADGGQDG